MIIKLFNKEYTFIQTKYDEPQTHICEGPNLNACQLSLFLDKTIAEFKIYKMYKQHITWYDEQTNNYLNNLTFNVQSFLYYKTINLSSLTDNDVTCYIDAEKVIKLSIDYDLGLVSKNYEIFDIKII